MNERVRSALMVAGSLLCGTSAGSLLLSGQHSSHVLESILWVGMMLGAYIVLFAIFWGRE